MTQQTTLDRWSTPTRFDRLALAGYDRVLAFHNRFVWRCPTGELIRRHSAHVGERHLEVGGGTGFLLDVCAPRAPEPRITLLDVNEAALAYASRRLARYQPDTVVANATEPWPVPAHGYDSVAMNYLLHCLDGDPRRKGVVLGHAAAAVRPGGVVFGATLITDRAGAVARRALRFYERIGAFSVTGDTVDGWREQLAHHFAEHDLRVIGSVALFTARTRR